MVVSDTGPLTSALQSDRVGLLVVLFGAVHASKACTDELIEQGWDEALARYGSSVVSHQLAEAEAARAADLAARVAHHPVSKDREPSHHLGEAEVMVLVQRAEFAGAILLVDELAARAVAAEAGLEISGFAGVLLLAVGEGLLTADQAREALVCCHQQGTHYGWAFIERVFQAAKEVEKDG